MLKFDHVALGVGDHRGVVAALTGDLGALVISGGRPPRAGFQAMQIRVGRGDDGMTVEVLEPHQPRHDDFLVRFLAAGGDRPHHVTFKTTDIEAELERLRSLGLEPVGIELADPIWRELFIHPRDGHGTLVQIAETDRTDPPMSEWLAGLPDSIHLWHGVPWWDETALRPAPPRPAVMRRVVIATPDRIAGDRFYSSVLGSHAEAGPTITVHRWDGGEIRLEDADLPRPRVDRVEIDLPGFDGEIGGVRFVGTDG